MKFCKVCNNMLYVSVVEDVDDGATLKFTCKNCNFSHTSVKEDQTSIPVIAKRFDSHAEEATTDDACVMNINFSDDTRTFKQFLSKNIKYDMTLPRVSNIACQKQCSKDKPQEVIYIKYDPINMKYLYFCCHCEHFWKLEH